MNTRIFFILTLSDGLQGAIVACEDIMRALDCILKKRNGEELTPDELRFFIEGYMSGVIPDYQMSAWLMAVFFQGMTEGETAAFTNQMLASGDTIDLSNIPGIPVDKHSTGGVGDKVSIILAPIVAACGVKVPMMSGRALGHTGGTLDKLDAIPGYSTALEPQRFVEIIAECGYAMTGQSERVAPADKRLYAMRDVTATVECVPLIVASILSKKFAEGAEALILDVKCGSGAFMKYLDKARTLARALVDTGHKFGKRIIAVITRMDEPLGYAVGNFLEVEESIACLGGFEPPDWDPKLSADLMEVTIRLASWMLVAAAIVTDRSEAERRVNEVLKNGAAWQACVRNIELQGGDMKKLRSLLGQWRASHRHEIRAERAGWIASVDAYRIGQAGVHLGTGRAVASDSVLPDVGIELMRKQGASVARGDLLCVLYGQRRDAIEYARELCETAYVIQDSAPNPSGDMIIEEIVSP